MTAAALLAEAAGTLAAAGVGSAEWDAERLLRHVLGWDRATLVASPQGRVPEPEVERYRALVRRRAAREPLQYIVGRQAFWKHDFVVTPAVLIPRPETELLVERGLELLKGIEEPVVVDVGTGSGCIALSIAAERKDAEVHATEVSEAALEVGRENARRLGLEGRVTFHHGRFLEPVSRLEVDLVVSNPPYVDPAERASLAPEVRDHEPPVALIAQGNPLSVYRALVRQSMAVLRPGGWLVAELGHGQAASVEALCGDEGLQAVRISCDLAGIPRVVTARRS
jgi:release factor glutamine methyltransferase